MSTSYSIFHWQGLLKFQSMASLFIKCRHMHYICEKAYILLILLQLYSLNWPPLSPLFNHENYPSNRHHDLSDFRLLCHFSLFQSHSCSFRIQRHDPASSRALNVLLPLTTGSSQIHISSHILLKHIFKLKFFLFIYQVTSHIFLCTFINWHRIDPVETRKRPFWNALHNMYLPNFRDCFIMLN